MIDETVKVNGRLSNNELLCEHPGTVASEDAVMLSEAASLCRCNVPCQLKKKERERKVYLHLEAL